MSGINLFTKHLFWAYRTWIEECVGKVHLVIHERNVKDPVLRKYIRDDFLKLNISTTAVRNLITEETYVSFSTKFNAVRHDVVINYDDIVGFISPFDDNLLPLNVIPVLLSDGPGLAIIQREEEIVKQPPTPITENPQQTKPALSVVTPTTEKVVNLADRRKPKD